MRITASDEDLAQAAAAGDEAAFASLLERRYNRLFRLCFHLSGARAEAKDLCQDICTALCAKLREYRSEARVTTWLWRMAVNTAHDWRRRQATFARAWEG
jgi:RNA polymerase sigma-70 factor (ECF subfamily)